MCMRSTQSSVAPRSMLHSGSWDAQHCDPWHHVEKVKQIISPKAEHVELDHGMHNSAVKSNLVCKKRKVMTDQNHGLIASR